MEGEIAIYLTFFWVSCAGAFAIKANGVNSSWYDYHVANFFIVLAVATLVFGT